MRHRLQSRQVMVGIGLAALEAVALAVVVAIALAGPPVERVPARPAWLFSHALGPLAPGGSVGGRELVAGAAALFGLLCFQVAGMLLLNGLFRRTTAGEAFFLVSFVLSLSPEVGRLLAAVAVFRGSAPALSVLATRLVYMGRLFGLVSLFFATLCSLGLRYGDYAVLSGVGLLLAAAMGSIVPVDSSSLTTGMMYAVTDGGGFLSVGATATIMVVLGAVLTPFVRQERRFAGYAAGIACLIAARELIGIGNLGAAAAALALFAGGTLLAMRSLERAYLGIS